MKAGLLACLSILAFSVAACGEPAETPSAARQLLNLGMLTNEANAKAPNGPVQGVTLAISEYNRDPDSTYRVRMRRLVGDGTPERASQLAGELAETERLIGTVGALGADETSAAAPVFERASIPFLATSVDAGVQAGSRAFRRLVANAGREGAVMARYIARRVNAPAIIFHDGSTAGSAFVEGAKRALEAAQRPVHSSQRISARTDLEGVLGSFPSDAPSFVMYGGDGGLGATFADVLRNKGRYKGQIVASHQIIEAKAKGLPDGLLAASVAASPAAPELQEFADRFSARFEAAPGPLAVESYEGALMLLEAVEEVEPKAREIVDFLQLSRSFLGDSKLYEYDENGELKSPTVWIYASKDGEWTLSGSSQRPRRSPGPPD